MTREDASEILTKCFCDIILPRCDGKVFVRLSLEQAIITAIEALKEEPRKSARWIPYLKEELKWKCSECGSRFTIPFRYCPSCGAEMEKENDK